MPEIILNCPQCGRTLRVPENLLGRLVKCPACGLTFSAPDGAAEPEPVAPAQVDQYSPEADFEEGRPQGSRLDTWAPEEAGDERARALITPPAILMLLSGILGLLADVGQALYVAAKIRFPDPAPAQPPQNILEALQQEIAQGAAGPVPIILGAVFAIMSILVIIAAVQMLRLRAYAFAIAGTVLAMVNAGNCCCLLGLPAGIWALATLSRPEVRSAFSVKPP
jgi:hypothetical protein